MATSKLSVLKKLAAKRYNPEQPRDASGKWASTGSTGKVTIKPAAAKGTYDPDTYVVGVKTSDKLKTIRAKLREAKEVRDRRVARLAATGQSTSVALKPVSLVSDAVKSRAKTDAAKQPAQPPADQPAKQITKQPAKQPAQPPADQKVERHRLSDFMHFLENEHTKEVTPLHHEWLPLLEARHNGNRMISLSPDEIEMLSKKQPPTAEQKSASQRKNVAKTEAGEREEVDYQMRDYEKRKARGHLSPTETRSNRTPLDDYNAKLRARNIKNETANRQAATDKAVAEFKQLEKLPDPHHQISVPGKPVSFSSKTEAKSWFDKRFKNVDIVWGSGENALSHKDLEQTAQAIEAAQTLTGIQVKDHHLLIQPWSKNLGTNGEVEINIRNNKVESRILKLQVLPQSRLKDQQEAHKARLKEHFEYYGSMIHPLGSPENGKEGTERIRNIMTGKGIEFSADLGNFNSLVAAHELGHIWHNQNSAAASKEFGQIAAHEEFQPSYGFGSAADEARRKNQELAKAHSPTYYGESSFAEALAESIALHVHGRSDRLPPKMAKFLQKHIPIPT